MTVHSLKQSAGQDRLLRDQLLARFGEALAEDEQALFDSLDGISDFAEQALAVLRSSDHDEALANAAKEQAKVLEARAARLMERAQSKRAAIQHAMSETGRKKLELPDATLSLRNVPPAVVVTDEARIPVAYFVQPPAKLDKKALKGALLAGVPVPGATMGNGSVSLSVRRA